MDMDQAAVFFAASVLTALGFLIWVGFVLLVNNLVHKYWKSWGWSWMNVTNQQTVRFMSDEEAKLVEPTFGKAKK
jgi:glutathionylspermidine synthase